MLGETAARRCDPFGAEQARIRMRQQAGLAQHKFAHGFQIMQRGLVAEVAESLAHLGEEKFGLIAQAEEGLGAAEFFAGAGDLEDFVGSHGVRAGSPGSRRKVQYPQ